MIDWILFYEIPLVSILGPLLFPDFTSNILRVFKKREICNFVDDGTIYSVGDDANVIFKDLKHGNLHFLGKMA